MNRESGMALVSGFNVPAEIGASLEDIHTPALIIDLDAFERNVERMAKFVNVYLTANGGPHRSAVLRLCGWENGCGGRVLAAWLERGRYLL